MKRIYDIKNISELLNKTLDHFLPKYAINFNVFISKFKKLFSNGNTIVINDNKNNNQRYDFHLQSLIYIINENKLNEKPKWIGIQTYIDSLLFIIKDNCKINSDKDINKIFKEINYWNIIDYSEKTIEQLLSDENDDLLKTRIKD